MINQKLQDFEEEVKAIGNVVTEATLDVYNTVVQRFLPTPAKIHYLFNLRDISKVSYRPIPRGPRSPASPASRCSPGSLPARWPTPLPQVFQGMLRANKDFHDTKSSITRLWIHECFR